MLALLGLPAGEDMEGRVLVGAFEGAVGRRGAPADRFWEEVPGEDGRGEPAGEEEDPAVAQAVLNQFVRSATSNHRARMPCAP